MDVGTTPPEIFVFQPELFVKLVYQYTEFAVFQVYRYTKHAILVVYQLIAKGE